jgi:hypothetical protein
MHLFDAEAGAPPFRKKKMQFNHHRQVQHTRQVGKQTYGEATHLSR